MSRSALTKVLRYNTKAYIEKLCVRKSKRGLSYILGQTKRRMYD